MGARERRDDALAGEMSRAVHTGRDIQVSVARAEEPVRIYEGSGLRAALARQAAELILSGVIPLTAVSELLGEAKPRRRPRPRVIVDDDPEFACLRPDPRSVRTGAELAAALRDFREWAGEPSLSEMADRCGQMVSRSTMHRALNSRATPALKEVMAIITGCGGSEADKKRFASAWRRIRSGEQGTARPLRAVPPARAAG